jgi:hypothetical protein
MRVRVPLAAHPFKEHASRRAALRVFIPQGGAKIHDEKHTK